MNKTLLLFILFIGIIFIVIDVTKNSAVCPKEQIIYKYIPRTFADEEAEPTNVTDIFKTMFEQPSPWIASISNIDNRKQEAINKYFISQA